MPPARATAGGGDRIEPVDIQQEMQRSYIDYAMSVIVGRALPLVEDGLKPVHRRVLYSMGENGFRPDRSYVKCARVGRRGDGQLPPARRQLDLRRARAAGPALVDALPADRRAGQLRLAGQRPGGGHEVLRCPASRVRMADGSSVPHRRRRPGCRAASGQSRRPQGARPQWRPGARRDALPLRRAPDASRVHSRGLRADRHAQPPGAMPGERAGIPTLLWKLLEEIRPGDRVALQRTPRERVRGLVGADAMEAFLLGAFVSEGFVSANARRLQQRRRGVLRSSSAAYDAVVGGPRYVSSRTIASGSVLHELDVQDLTALRRSVLAEVTGRRRGKRCRSRSGRAPRGASDVFLQASVHRRRLVLGPSTRHCPGLLLDPQRAARQGRPATPARVRRRVAALPARDGRAQGRPHQPCATPGCSPTRVGFLRRQAGQADQASSATQVPHQRRDEQRPRSGLGRRSSVQHGATTVGRPQVVAPAQRRPHRAVGAAGRGDPARTSPSRTRARSRRSSPAAGSTTPRWPT